MSASTESDLPFAVVVTGEPIERARLRRGGYPSLIRDALGSAAPRFVELDAQREPLPELSTYGGIVVTGSSASVTERAPWMLAAEARLREALAARVPLLGLCFGHQLLGQALGGRVERNPNGREIGTVSLQLLEADPLLDAAANPFLVNMTHVDSLVELPPGARVLARSELDPAAAVRFGPSAWGVQFHPEIDAEVMADYVEVRAELLASEGLDARQIRQEVAETPAGRAVLRRFVAEVARGREGR
jgi:GMP synthase (glutamine-hydrolysing)